MYVHKNKSKHEQLFDPLLPFVSAVVSIKPSEIQGRAFDYIVITRRSCHRAGTRYNTRGVDIEGNVGNFNETEQIVIDSQGNTTSYIQTRGFVFFFLRFYFFVLENKYKTNIHPSITIAPFPSFGASKSTLSTSRKWSWRGSQIL